MYVSSFLEAPEKSTKAIILHTKLYKTIIMKSVFFYISFLIALFNVSAQNDWGDLPIPGEIANDNNWILDTEHSDNFNYANKSAANFRRNWIDNHRNRWSGPGLTQFSSDYSYFKNGNLIINSGKVNNISGKRIYCGYVTTKNPIMFPVYTEVNMKVSASWLSSNYWLLSADDVNEIDITETYGKDDSKGRTMNTNYHIFQRSPFKDLTPNNGQSHKSNGNVLLKDGYHRFGVYWKSATEFIYFFDGKPVRYLNRQNGLTDPRNRFFDQPMHIIINMEDHPWRVNRGLTPTDAELADIKLTEMFVDWVRTYKVSDGTTPPPPPTPPTPVVPDAVSLLNVPKTVESSTTFSVDVAYETTRNDMEVYVSLWKEGKWVAAKDEIVNAGEGTKRVTITLEKTATPGNDYFFKYHIRPRGTDYKQATDGGETGKFTVIDNSLSVIDFGKDYNQGFINPITDGILELKNVPVGTSIKLIAISGQVILETVSDNDQVTNVSVNEVATASYILKIGEFKAKHLVIQN